MLEIRGVSKSFAGVQALHDVSFEVAAGEVHAIVGENGAGKSTLMKILSGAHTDYTGELFLNDEPLVLHNPRDAQRHGIAIIYQELNLIPELTVAENIFLGRELRNATGLLDTAAMDRAARELLDRLVLPISTKRQVKTLRVGEQQLVEVAKALSLDARLLILDEPTSALSEAEIRHLFDVIAALKAHGVTLIYISHKFDEVFAIADRVTVLRDGEYIDTVAAADTDQRQLIRMMVGRPLSDLFPRTDAPIGDEVLRVEDLTLSASRVAGTRAVGPVSFTLRRGEILGVAGLMGAGRTELLEAVFGVHSRRRVRGRVFLDGTERRITSPPAAIAAGLAFVTEDRKTQSLITLLSVKHNMTLAALRRFLRFNFVRRRSEETAVQRSIDQLRIKTPSASSAGGHALGRQPAEGRPGQVPADPAERAPPRRTDPRHRRRGQGGDLHVDRRARPSGCRDRDGLVGASRAAGDVRPHPRVEPRSGDGRAEPRRGDAGTDHRGRHVSAAGGGGMSDTNETLVVAPSSGQATATFGTYAVPLGSIPAAVPERFRTGRHCCRRGDRRPGAQRRQRVPDVAQPAQHRPLRVRERDHRRRHDSRHPHRWDRSLGRRGDGAVRRRLRRPDDEPGVRDAHSRWCSCSPSAPSSGRSTG